MIGGIRKRTGTFSASLLLAGLPALFSSLPTPARAQASGMAGIGGSETMSLHAKVTAIDLATRTVTLVGPRGNSQTLQVGNEVHNLPQVKPGDTVNVLYHASVTYVLSPSKSKLPNNSLTAAATRAAPGQLPAGAFGAKMVQTWTVVDTDLDAHTIRLVEPSGGQIRTENVVTPEGQQSMKMIKSGDTVTAVISEALAIAVEPAS
jgi:hypothetical protein